MRPFDSGQNFQNLLRTSLPDFVESEYPQFVEFIHTFVQFLEQERTTETQSIIPAYGPPSVNTTVTTALGGPLYETRRILTNRDTMTAADEFRQHFMSMFAQNFPQYSYADTDWFVRSLREFYQRKGTKESFQWFFRVFFNEDADIYYPREDVFRASDGTWIAPITLKVSSPLNDYTDEDVVTFYTGQRITTDTGQAVVERVQSFVVSSASGEQRIVHELMLKYGSIGGTFTYGQQLRNIDTDEQVITEIYPVLSAIQVAAGGTNYAIGDFVRVSEGPAGGGGYGAYGTVQQITSGSISGIAVVDGGDGYTIGEPIQVFSGSGSGAAGNVASLSNVRTAVFLDLTIEPFINVTSTVTLDDVDYGTETGVATLIGFDIDSLLANVYAAADTKPFYTPWCWTDSANTTAELANAAILVDNISRTPFVNSNTASEESFTGDLYVINGITDTLTVFANSTLTSTPFGYFVGGLAGNTSHTANATKLYLNTISNLGLLTTSLIVKQDFANTQDGTITTYGNSTVTGNGTTFSLTLATNAHFHIGNSTVGYDAVIRSIESNTSVTIYGSANVVTSNVYSTYPMGLIRNVFPRAQTSYGTINTVVLTSVGTGYRVPPLIVVDSMDARVQSLFYFSSANDDIISTENRAVTMFQEAELEVVQGAGQIAKVKLENSGVLYTDANSIVINAEHANGVDGIEASFVPVLGALTFYSGQFVSTKSFASADKYLQDGNYYNDYTYVVKTAQSFDRYRSLLLKLLHPAGFRPYGQFTLVSDVVLDTLLTNTILSIVDVGAESLSGGASIDIANTDIIYTIMLGESLSPRSRDFDTVRNNPEDSIFVGAADFTNDTDYDNALQYPNFTPRMHWVLDNHASLVSTGAQTISLTASGGVSTISDDAPTYPLRSIRLANTTQRAGYTFADANTVLFGNRSIFTNFSRGGLNIWYRPTDGAPAANAMVFGDRDWIWLSIDTNGKVHGQVAGDVNTNIISDVSLSPNQWHMLTLGFGDDSMVTDTLQLSVDGQLQAVCNVSANFYIPSTLSIGSSNTVAIPSALGRYGQATVLIERPTQNYIDDLYAAGQRDGTETLTIVRAGEGIDMLYYWSNTTINSLASNTIAQDYYANATIGEVLETEVPESGLE